MSLNDPRYLNKLADMADPEQLWRLPLLEQLDLPEKKRMQLDAGVALRRHASDVAELQRAKDLGLSVLYTKIPGGRAHGTQPMSKKHLSYWERHGL